MAIAINGIAAAATVPGAPTIGVATAGNASASVPFTAPASDGGSAILDYTITSSLAETLTVTASPANFTGLSAVARTFTATARNAVGTGAASAASNAVTPTLNAAPTFTGTIADITGNGGTAITPVNVSTLFSDGDALAYTASPVGTAWPAGLVIDSATGVISGAVAASTTNAMKVRATDTAGQTVDSNAFSATISAPASTVTSVDLTPATATVAGGGTLQITGIVNGTGSPSQTINYTTTAGSVTAGGLVTLPATTASIQTVTVTGVSAQNNTYSDTVVITVPALATVSFSTGGLPLGRAASGAARAGVVVRASVLPITGSDTPLVTFGSNLTLDASGIPPAFAVSGITAGAVHPVKYTNIADPLDCCICNLTAV